jgi:hypothetical protein
MRRRAPVSLGVQFAAEDVSFVAVITIKTVFCSLNSSGLWMHPLQTLIA